MVKAIVSFLRRISCQLAEFALIERNPVLKRNLEEMADINFRMADGVPATMREAIQWMCHFSMFSRLYNRGSAGGSLISCCCRITRTIAVPDASPMKRRNSIWAVSFSTTAAIISSAARISMAMTQSIISPI